MTISPSVVLGITSLWFAYLTAADYYEKLRKQWPLVGPCARSDGTAGQLYAQMYVAEQAKDNAYKAWDAARKLAHPSPPS
jgi:hypothetical protein